MTGTELREACAALVTAPGWRPGWDEVWDLSGAREVDVRPEELSALVEATLERADQIGRNRVAIVSTRDGVTVLIRLYQRLTAPLGRTYRVVRTRDEAETWLLQERSPNEAV